MTAVDEVAPDTQRRRPGDEVARLIEEAEAVTGPVAWPRVEALVAALVALYGEGLERTLACARAAAREGESLDVLLAKDELVSSLLMLHDLHPLTIEMRIEAALERVRTELPGAAALVLTRVDNGVVKLKVAPDTAPTTRAPPTTIVAREIERDAPEVLGVEVEGTAAAVPSGSGFVPVDRLTRGARP
jgi:hypothetical protein